MRKYWMIGAASAVACVAVSAAANAGPSSNAAQLLSTAQQSSLVDKVDYRRCSWINGERRCSLVRETPGAFGYGYTSGYNTYRGYQDSYPNGDYFVRPDDLATGSTEWWRVMDEDGRGGFGDGN